MENKLHEDFVYALSKHETHSKAHQPFSAQELSALSGKLPERLIEIMRLFGRFTFNDGWMYCCHPDDLSNVMEIILGEDNDFRPAECAA